MIYPPQINESPRFSWRMFYLCTRILGVKEFGCDNPDCHHVKYLTCSCGSRACPSCGKKATDLILPSNSGHAAK
ncbi:hypothetical protein EC12741_B0091 [Escherichia coli 1.2741]|nr:hypothetical protein EC12741_B0091 [Escherichia coli 1.2741]